MTIFFNARELSKPLSQKINVINSIHGRTGIISIYATQVNSDFGAR